METGITRTEILNRLNLSLHGDLAAYVPVIGTACKQDPEFVARLIAYDFVHGQIKDSKVALPVITVASREFPDELVENSLAHLAMQPPRELLKAFRFSITSKAPSRRQRSIESMIRRYLAFKETEPGKWNRLAIRHRRSLKSLYALSHAKAPEWVSRILFDNKYLPGSIFADVANLSKMEPAQVAATIQKWHLSPLVVSGAMTGAKAKQEDRAVVGATMDQMSDTEMVTRAASMERKGAAKDSGLKEKFRKRVAGATKSKKATLKTSVAADEVEDESLKTMLRELQERQIQAQKDAGRGIEGNWLIVCDRSQSQEVAIELGVHVAAAIAKFVTGRVWLVFCNQEAVPVEVTGMALEAIRASAKFMFANGATSYGVALQWIIEKNFEVDGVAIVGDGGENHTPVFWQMHREYQKKHDKNLPVYLYQTYCPPQHANHPNGDPRRFATMMESAGLQFTTYDFTSGKIDYYSLPSTVQLMSAQRFGVVEKIMACPLLTLDKVIPVAVTA